MRLAVALLIGLASGPVAAQNVTFSPAATERCLAETHDVEAQDLWASERCIGTSATLCMDETEGGHTTVGMGGCLHSEWRYWDARLNDAYQALSAREQALDAEMQERGSAAPSVFDPLRAMQRAWITFRDAACDYERAQWGGGTGGGPATALCLMRMTGMQALALEVRLADGR